jgi:hypothetical protein
MYKPHFFTEKNYKKVCFWQLWQQKMEGTNEKSSQQRTVHHRILFFLVIVLFTEAYGERRVIERASTQDDFAVPDGWEAVVFTMDNVTQHILNQVFKGTVA